MVVKVWRLGLTSYDTALKIQQTLTKKHLDAIRKGQDENYDTILLVEHKPIYTVGIRDETPCKEINRLRDLGADFRKTNRGGLITFHGPGQLIAYPVLNLKHFKTSVRWYVNRLEETVIKMCKKLNVNADRSEYTGVWVDDNKLAAIGIHASRYVTSHGVAINCDNNLEWFEHISPCGIEDRGVTSLTLETGKECSPRAMAPLFLSSFAAEFACALEELPPAAQQDVLDRVYRDLVREKAE